MLSTRIRLRLQLTNEKLEVAVDALDRRHAMKTAKVFLDEAFLARVVGS